MTKHIKVIPIPFIYAKLTRQRLAWYFCLCLACVGDFATHQLLYRDESVNKINI